MKSFFGSRELPYDMSRLIFDTRNKIIQAEKAEKAEKEEEEFKKLIKDNNLMAFTSENTLVPSRNGDKPLINIDIFSDGYDGNLWRHPTYDTTKAETLKKLHEEAMNDFDKTNWENFFLGGGMVNQKVKKCEKKKVVLGKERCIYKVSGSKKEYMKYKGKLVPVTDYVKYMKKKN